MIANNGRIHGIVARMARMATRVGADMGIAFREGRLSPEDLSSAITRCHGCTSTDECDAWLAAHPEGADRPPGYCRNADLLGDLRQS